MVVIVSALLAASQTDATSSPPLENSWFREIQINMDKSLRKSRNSAKHMHQATFRHPSKQYSILLQLCDAGHKEIHKSQAQAIFYLLEVCPLHLCVNKQEMLYSSNIMRQLAQVFTQKRSHTVYTFLNHSQPVAKLSNSGISLRLKYLPFFQGVGIAYCRKGKNTHTHTQRAVLSVLSLISTNLRLFVLTTKFYILSLKVKSLFFPSSKFNNQQSLTF